VKIAQLDPMALRDAYAEAKVVVVPLLPSDMDNGVTVILEAMAMGRPVIASRTPGQVDVIEDGVTGFLVSPGSGRRLREKIEQVLRDERGSEEVAARGRTYVERAHSLEMFAISVEQELKRFCHAVPDEQDGSATSLGRTPMGPP
jgi:glycosyltransferase involved in cell wall biosynthesis